jgi:hypothetical protein
MGWPLLFSWLWLMDSIRSRRSSILCTAVHTGDQPSSDNSPKNVLKGGGWTWGGDGGVYDMVDGSTDRREVITGRRFRRG